MPDIPLTPPDAYLQDLRRLQKQSFRLTLLFIIFATFVALLAGDLALRPVPTPFIASGFNLIFFCWLSYWLFVRYPRLARYVFVVGLIAGNTMAYIQFSSTVFLYFFALICLFASRLLPTTIVAV